MKLTEKRKIVTQPERSIEIEELTINRIDDFPSEQFVRVIINEIPGEIKLWEGEEYDETCAWTLEDVEARIEELLTSETGTSPSTRTLTVEA